MLVDFCVQNFRSFRDLEELSLVATRDKSLQETHTFQTATKGTPTLLKSAVIYGANASGKSNLIMALQFMRQMVLSSTNLHPNQAFLCTPFELDETSQKAPTSFEVSFLQNNVRYQYGFSLNKDRILKESLLVYKSFKPQRWFLRTYDEKLQKDIYEFSSSFKGSKSILEKHTRKNALFLSTAIQLNNEALRPIYDWFLNQLIIFNEGSPFGLDLTKALLKDPEKNQKICEFLAAADMSISEISVEENHQLLNFFPNAEREKDSEELAFVHKTKNGIAKFGLNDQSNGTRRFLSLIGYLLTFMDKETTFVIDELETSLHTLLVQEIVRLFYRTFNAQLIFTTHDISLLDTPYLFRRDQIWFVDKNEEQVSKLIALAEYSPRKNEALGKGYLVGRYGGIPFLDEMPEAAS